MPTVSNPQAQNRGLFRLVLPLKPLATLPYHDLHGAPEVRFELVVPPLKLHGSATLLATYTPHKQVVEAAVLTAWLADMTAADYPTWEDFGTALVDTFYDVVLPRKVEFLFKITAENGAGQVVKLVRAQPV